MEIKMKELEDENARILAENASLKALNARLMAEHDAAGCAMTPPPSCEGPVSPAPSSHQSDYSLVDSRSLESAEGSGSRVGRLVDGHDDDAGSGGLLSGGGECGQ